MTACTEEYINYVLEQLSPIRGVKSGRFFGGNGLSCNSVQFAMLMGNSLFFVVDDSTRPKYEAHGMECFWYKTRKGKVNVKKYFEVPQELLEDPDSLVAWARESIKIARSLKKK